MKKFIASLLFISSTLSAYNCQLESNLLSVNMQMRTLDEYKEYLHYMLKDSISMHEAIQNHDPENVLSAYYQGKCEAYAEALMCIHFVGKPME